VILFNISFVLLWLFLLGLVLFRLVLFRLFLLYFFGLLFFLWCLFFLRSFFLRSLFFRCFFFRSFFFSRGLFLSRSLLFSRGLFFSWSFFSLWGWFYRITISIELGLSSWLYWVTICVRWNYGVTICIERLTIFVELSGGGFALLVENGVASCVDHGWDFLAGLVNVDDLDDVDLVVDDIDVHVPVAMSVGPGLRLIVVLQV